MRRYILSIFLILNFNLCLIAQTYQYHEVPATSGDGAFSLLRRYQLADYPCNISKFFSLNKLSAKDGLKIGRYYKIPIILYKFNGKTIRSSIGKNDWTLAKNIERYNEEMLKNNNRKKDFRVDKKLWVPYHLYHCADDKKQSTASNKPKAKQPKKTQKPKEKPKKTIIAAPTNGSFKTTNGHRTYPIFGKKYAYTPLVSNELAGKVYYIVSGHGGPDPGAIGKQGKHQLCEDEYAYDVALRLCRNLIEHGATAYMIIRDVNDGIRDEKYLKCDYDEVIWGGQKIYRQQKPRLFQRSNAINTLYEKHKRQGVDYQRAIIIHVDSRNKSHQTDLFFYHTLENDKSKNFATELHQTMKRKYAKHRISGEYEGTVSPRDLHMLREILPPAAYIELGNIKNSFDQQRVVIPSNRDALAKWLCESILP